MKHSLSVMIMGLGLTLGAAAAPSAAEAPVKLRVGTLPYLSNTILQIALEDGYFRDQGLEVELIPFRASGDFIPLLIKGDLDAAPPALNPAIFNAIAQGAGLRMVLPLTIAVDNGKPTTAFVARKEDVQSGRFATPGSWKGARVATATGVLNATSYILARQLTKANLTLKDVTIPTIDSAVQPDALAKGQIDIALVSEPWLSRMMERPDLALLAAAEPITPDLALSTIVFGPKLLKDHALGVRFAKAYLKALRQYREGKTAHNIQIVIRLTGLDEATVKKMQWPETSPDGRINPRSLLEFEDWLDGLGALDRRVSMTELIDESFALEAAR